ncbi:MAG: hypothetical protein ACR2G5_04210 [Pyrinomonadaceae bacterium]
MRTDERQPDEFRHIVRFGVAVERCGAPVLKRDCVESTVRRLALDGDSFERIFALTDKGTQTLSGAGANELFATYLVQIERVIEAVDRTT